MEVRHPVHPEHMQLFDTEELRENFLIADLFVPDKPKLIYSFYDRLIVGGICPSSPVSLDIDPAILGASFFCERRELGVINVGESGTVIADGVDFSLEKEKGSISARERRRSSFTQAIKNVRLDFI